LTKFKPGDLVVAPYSKKVHGDKFSFMIVIGPNRYWKNRNGTEVLTTDGKTYTFWTKDLECIQKGNYVR
tara:strand:+ start:3307 stop:3513 length:207 start_codon:yes stop_codon:yes gene_type:complete